MFSGSMLDVAIGLLVLFLVASLMASAVVEAIGGFLHRRQKHLWDTLDLLLGNTSLSDDQSGSSIVNELYKQPFITGLVRPTDRVKFKPEAHADADAKAPMRGRPTSKTRARDEELRRRYYGPAHIESREFANALLSFLRAGGKGDRVLAAFNELKVIAAGTAGTVAQASLTASLDELKAAVSSIDNLDISSAINSIENAGAALTSDDLRTAVAGIESSIGRLLSGHTSQADYTTLVSTLPVDLQLKLGAVVTATGNDFVEIRKGVEEWFDRSMAAASDWYRKQTRWFLFIAGLFLAVSLNADAVRAATTLYRDDQARAAVVKIAEQVGEVTCPSKTTATTLVPPDTTAPATTTSGNASVAIDLECVRSKVGSSISLPIGWTNVKWRDNLPVRLIGWLIVAASVTVGAPFWFDLLRRALNVRRSKGGTQ